MTPRGQTPQPPTAPGARWIRPGPRIREMFDGARVLRIEAGEHRVVAERRGRPDGAWVAREVLMIGGQVECSGRMDVIQYGGLVAAGLKATVFCLGGRVESHAAEVRAFDACEVIGREETTIYVEHGDVLISAHDDTLVILNPGITPVVKLFDSAQIVRWQK